MYRKAVCLSAVISMAGKQSSLTPRTTAVAVRQKDSEHKRQGPIILQQPADVGHLQVMHMSPSISRETAPLKYCSSLDL